MKIMMIAAMIYSDSDGIFKKICMQASGLSSNNDKCDLLCLGDSGILVLTYINEKLISKKQSFEYNAVDDGIGGIRHEKDLLNYASQFIVKNNCDMAYIRHMLPCPELIKLLKKLKRNKTKIGYEIPTYPYYNEQINISHNKVKTFVKLMVETAYWPQIYKLVDKLFVVKCNIKARHYKKMVSMYNGFSGEYKPLANRDCNDLNMIGVGTIYPYHGYELVIKNMQKCNSTLSNGNKVYFHIVGDSVEIQRLKHYVAENGLEKNVLFYGKKYGDGLEEIYHKCNLGIGTMALKLRNADVDTAIKNIEYFSVGLPVITNGNIFDISTEKGMYYKIMDTNNINFNDIMKFVDTFFSTKNREIDLRNLIKRFSWGYIMESIKRGLKN